MQLITGAALALVLAAAALTIALRFALPPTGPGGPNRTFYDCTVSHVVGHLG